MSISIHPTMIIGVIDPSDSGCGFMEGNSWTFRFAVKPWRIDGGPINESQLEIKKPQITEVELKALMKAIKAYGVYKLLVVVSSDEGIMHPTSATLDRVINNSEADPELTEYSLALQKPVIASSSIIGELTLDRNLNSYETSLIQNGKTFDMRIILPSDQLDKAALEIAERVWQKLDELDARWREYAVVDLLPTKNDNWLDEEEDPITKEQFLANMQLEAICIYPDGHLHVYYNDNDMFWGHTIEVRGNVTGEITEATISG